ncbi:hypothetical protein HMPREF1548_05106 [Clostridium sp. KLE 1755]|nr:hypothetical protein HMPREF1548_05106 [Clostridium sp. KLE 1755]
MKQELFSCNKNTIFGIIAQFLSFIFVRYFLDSCTVKCYSISPSINKK